jgi:hypothetical protein
MLFLTTDGFADFNIATEEESTRLSLHFSHIECPQVSVTINEVPPHNWQLTPPLAFELSIPLDPTRMLPKEMTSEPRHADKFSSDRSVLQEGVPFSELQCKT